MSTLLQHLVNGLSLGAIYALIALGYTLVYGILRLFNFAHGDIFMAGAFTAMFVGTALVGGDAVGVVQGGFETRPYMTSGLGAMLITLAVAMAAAAFLGLLIERFAYRPLRGQPRINLLIIAVGVSLLLENLGQAIFGPTPRLFPELLPETSFAGLADSGLILSNLDLTVLGCSLALMLALEWLVQRTRWGRAMRATAHSHDTANLLGIPVNRVIALTFVIGSALAAAAAVLYGMKYPRVDPLMGVIPGLKAFVAAVLGGIGNLRGAVVGGLLLGLAETLVAAYGASTWRDALAFGLLIGVLLFKPEGLFGANRVEKV